MISKTTVFVLNIIAATVAAASNNVPVVFWGSERSQLSLPSVSALHSVGTNEFKKDYFEKLTKEAVPLVVFLQDTLSVDDFSQYGNAYGETGERSAFTNLQEQISHNPALFLQAVDSPAEALQSLPHSVKLVTLDEGHYGLGGRVTGGQTVLLIKLPNTKHSKDRRNTLNSNDEIVGKVLQELKDKDLGYNVMYTGSEASWFSSEKAEETNRVARDLQQTVENGDGFYDTPCVLMYTSNVSYYFNVTATGGALSATTKSSKGTCNESEEVMTINFTDASIGDVTVTMTFKNVSSEWKLDTSVSFSADSKQYEGAVNYRNRISAPIRFSYSCGHKNISIPVNSTDGKPGCFSLLLKDFQIEPFLEATTTSQILVFNDSFDCVGFFSIPILMGIMCVGILLIILFVGILAMMSIKTMDRFDDPKGKAIAITTSE